MRRVGLGRNRGRDREAAFLLSYAGLTSLAHIVHLIRVQMFACGERGKELITFVDKPLAPPPSGRGMMLTAGGSQPDGEGAQ